MLTVVKVGGAVARSPEDLAAMARGVAALPGRLVVVHGGGPEITAWQERLDIPVAWNGGLRVTTPEGMKITAMVLSGWVNKRVVGALLDAGEPAVGLSGEDDLLRAARKADGALGEVGEIVAVNPTPLDALLAAGITPVVSPVSRGPGGVPLNVNADEAAIALAGGLSADTLLLVSDVPGVVVGGSVLPEVDADRAERLVRDGTVTGGMAVKVGQALVAAAVGVDVRIGGDEMLWDPSAGTTVVSAAGRAAPATARAGRGA